MPVVDGKHYAYTKSGMAAAKRAKKAKGGKGESLYGKNHRQAPPHNTHGTFNPAKSTENTRA
jgi:hypothetical protein